MLDTFFQDLRFARRAMLRRPGNALLAILIVAIGAPEVVIGDQVRPGAVVIDVGMNRVDDPTNEKGYRLAGDVHFESAREVASAITPVPGGVGPMTVAGVVHNTLAAAEQAAGRVTACTT